MKEQTFIPANAICLDCGTTKENPQNGFCIHGHDNWLESGDDISRFIDAANKFKVNIENIAFSIKNGIDLCIKLKEEL